MRNVKSSGIQVSPLSPTLGSSRRHFLSAVATLGGLLAMVVPARPMGNYDQNRHGPHCFLKGTQIRTPQGERLVEDLRIGDLVLTVSGDTKPIKWIGRMRFERDGRTSWDKAVAPIRIACGAFNGDLPHSDLYVSYGHCFLINGLLISAGDLINGSSITSWQPPDMDVFEYLHIELESHDVILANGAPAETLPGDASHGEFDNFDEYVALYGAALTPQTPYAPIIIAGSGRRQALRSHVRGVLAPLYDRRQPLEIIRDELARQAHRSSAA